MGKWGHRWRAFARIYKYITVFLVINLLEINVVYYLVAIRNLERF